MHLSACVTEAGEEQHRKLKSNKVMQSKGRPCSPSHSSHDPNRLRESLGVSPPSRFRILRFIQFYTVWLSFFLPHCSIPVPISSREEAEGRGNTNDELVHSSSFIGDLAQT